jgi:hypothetical protein
VTGTKHWYYTHKKVRSAYMSLERNLPYLFTYQKYPKLNIRAKGPFGLLNLLYYGFTRA